jgi:minimal PKS acyl carrier protein
MAAFDLAQLLALFNQSDERDEDVEVVLDAERADWEFERLGFDSLALFNIVAGIERRFSISIGYDAVIEAGTPIRLLAFIQRRIDGRD